MHSEKFVTKFKNSNIQANKALGQNFIFDRNILRKIVEQSGNVESASVVEIGAGPGGLTRALLKAGIKKIVVLEKDVRFHSILKDLSKEFPNRVEIIMADALEIDIFTLHRENFRIIANLPYNISTALLTKWLTPKICQSGCESFTLMFQKEVARRIVAKIGSRSRSRLSCLTELYTSASIKLTLPPECFVPRPKVESCIVHFNILERPRYIFNQETFDKILRCTFNQKRKMIKTSLKIFGKNIQEKMKEIGIDGTLRPENLELEKFCKLSLIE